MSTQKNIKCEYLSDYNKHFHLENRKIKEIQQLLIDSNSEMCLARYLKALYLIGVYFLIRSRFYFLGGSPLCIALCGLWLHALGRCSFSIILLVSLGAAQLSDSLLFFSIYAYQVISSSEESQTSNILIHSFFTITLLKIQ